MSLQVEFDPIFNFRDFTSGVNVAWADGGIMDNKCQWVLFFGTAADIATVQTRFQIAFMMLEKRQGIKRVLNIEVGGSASNPLVE